MDANISRSCKCIQIHLRKLIKSHFQSEKHAELIFLLSTNQTSVLRQLAFPVVSLDVKIKITSQSAEGFKKLLYCQFNLMWYLISGGSVFSVSTKCRARQAERTVLTNSGHPWNK